MVTQSEQVLENGLIKTLMEMNYEYISIKEEDNLYANFKKQLEKHNKRELSLHKRKHFTDKEFEKICIYLEGGTRFEKAKKLRDLAKSTYWDLLHLLSAVHEHHPYRDHPQTVR